MNFEYLLGGLLALLLALYLLYALLHPSRL